MIDLLISIMLFNLGKNMGKQVMNLFILGENDKEELKEAFLLNPQKYIRSIREIDF